MERLTVIDLDSIVYVVAYNNQDEIIPEVVRSSVRAFIDDIIKDTDADAYTGFYQVEGHTNYRKTFFPEYKSNRKATPDFIKQWRPLIHEVFDSYKGIVGVKIIESDDALNIINNRFKDRYSIILAHIDKDLDCIPGEHFNYRSGKKYTVSREEGDFFGRQQVIMGDSGDGIPGVKGVGKVGAKKFTEAHTTVVQAYRAASLSKKITRWHANFFRDYHCIRLLNNLEELKKFTDQEEVSLFKIQHLVNEEEDTEGLDWS